MIVDGGVQQRWRKLQVGRKYEGKAGVRKRNCGCTIKVMQRWKWEEVGTCNLTA